MSETATSLAAKLAQVQHRSPDIQMTSAEARARAERLCNEDYAQELLALIQAEARARAERLCNVTGCGQPARTGDTLCADCDSETEGMRQYLRAREAYLAELNREPSRLALWYEIARAWLIDLWPRISHAAISLGIIAIVTLALIAGCAVTAKGAEVSGRWTMAEVTSYCPCALCCGMHDRTTANNTNTDAVPYAFASDRSLPFGARIYVPIGLGLLDRVRASDRWFAVDDRGGALDTEARRYGVLRLDLRVRDHAWAVRFGRRTVPVFVEAMGGAP